MYKFVNIIKSKHVMVTRIQICMDTNSICSLGMEQIICFVFQNNAWIQSTTWQRLAALNSRSARSLTSYADHFLEACFFLEVCLFFAAFFFIFFREAATARCAIWFWTATSYFSLVHRAPCNDQIRWTRLQLSMVLAAQQPQQNLT